MEHSLTFWELWQIETYGDLLEKKFPEEEIENGFSERARNDAWLDDQQHFSLTEQEF